MKKKKLTLVEAWKYCMEQWEYVHEKLKRARVKTVQDLKMEWAKAHGHNVEAACFFCEYATQHGDGFYQSCAECPGKKIDPDFNCKNPDYRWDYRGNSFYNKLQELYKIRRSKKKIC